MSEVNPNSEDISSYSNFNEIVQKEVDMDVSLDFDKKQMIGKMDVKYEILSSDIPKIVLDLKGPQIEKVEYIQNMGTTFPQDYNMAEYYPVIVDEFYLWYCKKHGIKIPDPDEDF